MNFNQRKIFYAFAHKKSFIMAARELFLTQPAVTIGIQKTEKEYETRLFDRGGRKGVSMRVVMNLASNEAIRKAVEGGLGISIISQYVAEKEMEQAPSEWSPWPTRGSCENSLSSTMKTTISPAR